MIEGIPTERSLIRPDFLKKPDYTDLTESTNTATPSTIIPVSVSGGSEEQQIDPEPKSGYKDSLLRNLRCLNREIVKSGMHRVETPVTSTIWHTLAESEFQDSSRRNNQRLIVILNSRGCSYAMKGEGPCFNCGLVSASNQGAEVPEQSMMQQFKEIINSYDFDSQEITELDLFNAGSLLDDWQVSADTRRLLFAEIATIDNIKDILIDSRPEDITEEKILTIKKIIGDKELWVGIGLETADDVVRNLCINKSFPLKKFETAVQTLQKLKANLFVYLMFKPAFLTEQEAIEDTERTIKYLTNLSKKLSIPLRISLEPGVVQGDCLLTELYLKGFYATPWLWSVVRVIKETYQFTNGCLRVGIPEEVPQIIDRRHNYNANGASCDCSGLIEKCILDFNQRKEINAFDCLPRCACRTNWRIFLREERDKSKIPLEERIKSMIQSL